MLVFLYLIFFFGEIRSSLTIPLVQVRKQQVEEKQHAICRITSDIVNATANATLTRKLEGVCTTEDLHLRLSSLEENLIREIKNLYLKVPKKSGKRETQNGINNSIIPIFQDQKDWETYTNLYREESSSSLLKGRNSEGNVREVESVKFNLTFQDSNLGNTFVYFWKIDGINEILNYNDNVVLYSNSFLLHGQKVFIKFFPNHLGTKYVAFELIQANPLPLKHRFSILNFNNIQKDLTSQILWNRYNYATTYRVSHKKIQDGDFIRNGFTIVKVTIFINY